MAKEKKKNHLVLVKGLLISINIILICIALATSLFYSKKLNQDKQNTNLNNFSSTIESMKQLSINYFQYECNYAKDWKKYINQNDFTIEQALNYINSTNDKTDRYVHIVDMDNYEAYSSMNKQVNCYKKFSEEENDFNTIFFSTMKEMFLDKNDVVNVLGKYMSDDIQTNVISVGTRITLRDNNNQKKDYLLLRIIPVSSVRDIWVFPVEYQSAEIGIMQKTGRYVIQSDVMKSFSFIDFIRSYNYEDDYNQGEVLYEKLLKTKKGCLRYKDSKGEDYYWYYSDLENDSGLDILGCIKASTIDVVETNWSLVFINCGILLLMVLIDGAYILHVNKQLRESIKAEEYANNAKTLFLSTMSHDIRTPLNGIVGLTALAKKHLDDQEYLEKCLDRTNSAGEHLLMLVNDILDISKIEKGEMSLTNSTFSLNQMTDRIIDIIESQVDSKNLEFKVERNFENEFIQSDELRLSQVILNILTNAIKYTPMDGNIKMKIEVSEDLQKPISHFVFVVRDNGIGMSKEFQKNMYHTFAREKDSRINEVQGSGLGLAIVKKIVALMNGTIDCQSEQGKGTTFTIKIDFDRVQDVDISMSTDDFIKNPKRILVVEDNSLNWEIIHEMLTHYSIETKWAKNGQECLNFLEEDHNFDLILMDIQMPLMNGKETTIHIRNHPNKEISSLKIVAMTADAFEEDIRECHRIGMNGHIAKPVDIKKVIHYLNEGE